MKLSDPWPARPRSARLGSARLGSARLGHVLRRVNGALQNLGGTLHVAVVAERLGGLGADGRTLLPSLVPQFLDGRRQIGGTDVDLASLRKCREPAGDGRRKHARSYGTGRRGFLI